MSQNETPNGVTAHKPVFFFDIDNCLYPRSTKVQDLMAKLIDEFFSKHLNLSWDDAVKLHKDYYTNYGLAIEGLVRHHEIDPLEYNSKVDDALPLEDILKPDPEIRQLLEDIDRSKVRLWLLTNAYVNHGKRVVKLLGIDDLFEGLTFCDYAEQPLVCKPSREMYLRAQKEAGVERAEDCFFVDDSYLNCQKAKEYGWTVAHLVEDGLPLPRTQASQFQIRHLRELRDVYPQFFKSTGGSRAE
ncbi:Haloacid dehalogenase-like hydrolase-domain-containing protein [Plectosphaerella cucumerina]|uniref:Haloacid dehalogenase-like hydrolase-domain-containing protein n=1 Tax=Plectosphaerella cucumerina TaxID=40658 RepID=A0A8K0TS18_9PEZI|nr:Haloacid dehalogenase-like hydrolase-domain-containing protein [Plectosphaerella cucumerina]